VSTRYLGGFITKSPTAPTTSAAPGIWTLDQALTYIKAGTWPLPPVGFIGLLGTGAFGRSITTESSGNIYVGGNSNIGSNNGLLAAYNSSGSLQWQKTFGDGASETFYSTAVDSSGNIYACGYSNASGDVFYAIVKYDSSGTVQWQINYGSSGSYSLGSGIAVDTSGDVYFTGSSNPSGASNIYTVKVNSSGTVQWQKRLSRPLLEAEKIATDSSGNVYVCGRAPAAYSGGSNTLFLVKYNSSGVLQWQNYLAESSNNTRAYGVATDSSGNVYIAGSEGSNTSFLVVKYDTSGTIQWKRKLGAGGSGTQIASAIAVDSSGNVYACGESDNSGTRDIQIVKYNTSGTIQWQRRLGASAATFGQGISVDNNGKIYVTGIYNSTYVFIAKLPEDGSSTGTYVVAGISFTYAASTLTDAVSSTVAAAGSLTDVTPSLSSSATGIGSATSTLTSSVTPI
tara:strand:- start:329 stop:1690 length:1362 start_codon:yes stop_codon:yes gene_type:complete